MSTPLSAGSFCWFELSTSNQNDANAFYQQLFGWDRADTDMGPAGVYTRFTIDGKDVAASCTLQPDQAAQGVPPNWLLYVLVDSVDDAVARAAAEGGRVLMPPFDVETYGRMAVIADPTGAVFALWQAMSHTGVGVTAIPHTCTWADLSTPDAALAMRFYSAVFGWRYVGTSEHTTPGPDDYAHIVNHEHMIGGIPPVSTRQPGTPAHWMLYFEVADCAKAVAKAQSLGALTYMDTTMIGANGAIAVLADRQGAVFALHQS